MAYFIVNLDASGEYEYWDEHGVHHVMPRRLEYWDNEGVKHVVTDGDDWAECEVNWYTNESPTWTCGNMDDIPVPRGTPGTPAFYDLTEYLVPKTMMKKYGLAGPCPNLTRINTVGVGPFSYTTATNTTTAHVTFTFNWTFTPKVEVCAWRGEVCGSVRVE